MPVPFGFGVGDFIAVGKLAWAVYKSSKEAPESFKNIHVDVLSLHALTKEVEETVFRAPLAPEREARLAVVKDGCMAVLTDLGELVKKYESLGTNSKRTWDRMRWGNEDINEIRARLNTSVTLLAAFISTSQASVEQKLDRFLQEFKQGKREGSVVSVQTVDSLTKDERAVWRTIRKELEDVGISLAAWQSNHDFILLWFARMIETGAFEEDASSSSEDTVGSLLPSYKRSPRLSQPTSSELQVPATENHNPQGPEGLHDGAQFERRSILLEDIFMCYVVALRAKSGSIGQFSSFTDRQAMRDQVDVLRLYNRMISDDPLRDERTAAVSFDVLFAAFDLFVSIAWKEKMGPLIEQDAWQALQTGFESDPRNFAHRFTNFLGDIAPQNRRCLAATIDLFRQLRNASRYTTHELRNLHDAIANILLPGIQAPRLGLLHGSVLLWLENDYEDLFKDIAPSIAVPDLSGELTSDSSIVGNQLRKMNGSREQQLADSSLQLLPQNLPIPASSAANYSPADHPKDRNGTSLGPSLSNTMKRSTLDSISRAILSSAYLTFSRPKRKLLAAATDASGTAPLAAILAEHQIEKEVLGYALVLASEAGVVGSMDFLIDLGADVNCLGEGRDKTPLSAAVISMRESAVDCLLARGANVNFWNVLVQPALHTAAHNRSNSLMRKLVSAGAVLDVEGRSFVDNHRVFFKAVSSSSPECVLILLQAGAQVNLNLSPFGTPLMHALTWRRENVAQVLVENGADIQQSSSLKRGRITTPMEEAIRARRPSQVKLLLNHNAVTTLDKARYLLDFARRIDHVHSGDLLTPLDPNWLTIVGYFRDVVERFSTPARIAINSRSLNVDQDRTDS